MKNMSKINRSLYAPRLWFGVEKTYAVIIVISEILLIGLGGLVIKIIGSIILVSVWVLLAWLNRYDHLFFTVLRRHMRRPTIYSAYSKVGSQHYKKITYRVK